MTTTSGRTSSLYAALLSTGFVSLAPNLILFAFPEYAKHGAMMEGSLLLSMGQALAAGGLLGDVFLHTMPEACNEQAGLWVLAGFFVFLIMDMVIRSLDHGHDDHHHDHAIARTMPATIAKSQQSTVTATKDACEKNRSALSMIFTSSILLNVTADMLHNFTDGLAIGASFAVVSGAEDHSSTSLSTLLFASRGGLATLSILLHEIPHELGDYCILLKNGFSKNEAIATQFVTAIAAFLGTLVGLWAAHTWPGVNYITAGGFVYLATVTILPSVLEDRKATPWFRLCQLTAFLVGIGFLYSVSFLEGEHGHGHSHQHHDHAFESSPFHLHEEPHNDYHHHGGGHHHDHHSQQHEL